MVDKDKRKFLDEIFFLGEQKEYNGIFNFIGKSINPVNTFKKTKEVLLKQRKSYDYTFVNICEKYDIQNIDEIYKDLDKMWDKESFFDKKNLFLLRFIPYIGTAYSLTETFGKIPEKWLSYIKSTREFSNKLVNSNELKEDKDNG